jgi:hypothetical protein
MISSRVMSELEASPGGGSMTTSQCSKSHPSRRIVSLGGRLLQFGDESCSEDVAGWVAKHRTPAVPRRARPPPPPPTGGSRSQRAGAAGWDASGCGACLERTGEEERARRRRHKGDQTAEMRDDAAVAIKGLSRNRKW